MPKFPQLVKNGGAAQSRPTQVRDKIKTIEELAVLARQARLAGETIVLCHGAFDLLHVGHVRHFETARREGTVLIVTLTADRFVNKGPNRPVFPEALRAEMVAALQCVDWVAINEAPTSEPVLHSIQPSVYVKGAEYRDPDDDLTGKIVNEREAVEAHGGRIAFTEDITFSSSTLINRHLNVYRPELADYLETMRQESAFDRICNVINSVADYKVLVIGDAIIDEYQYVSPLGKSPKENIIATLYQNREAFAGGAIATANHAASFCRQVDLVTCLGDTESYEDLIRQSLKPNVSLRTIVKASSPTTRKTRFVESYSLRKLFEVYSMDDTPLGGPANAELHRLLRERLKDYDAVIVNDFGHGFLRGDTLSILAKEALFLGVNAQSNSANLGYNLITRYPRTDYICIDTPEAHLAVSDKHIDLVEIVHNILPKALSCPRIVITRGKYGCLVRDPDGTAGVPALTNTIVDTVGAGDAFFAVTAPMVAAGASMSDIGFIGNAAGALKVGIVGHRAAVDKVSLLKFITALLK